MLKLHDLYGQSFAHEFMFTNPDSIRNAVKRYNLQRAAERDEYKKDRESHKLCKPRFCKMRNTGRDVVSMVTSRDLDVETQMSIQAKDLTDIFQDPISTNSCSCASNSSSNNSSESEQETGIQFVQRLGGGADTMVPFAKSRGKKMRNRKPKRVAAKPKVSESDPYTKHIQGLHREVCAELEYMGHTQSELRVGFSKRKQKPLRNAKQPIKPKPKRVFNQPTNNKNLQRRKPVITPASPLNNSEPDLILQRLKQVLSKEEPLKAKRVSYEDVPQPRGQWADIIPSPMMPQAINMNVCEPMNMTPSAVCLFMEQHVNGEPEPLETFFVEDSDLEQEYADRPGYMRYVERLPFNHSDPDTAEDGGQEKHSFVELGPHPLWISLQRSMKPMRYTSQRSDTDTCTLCDQEEQLLYSKKVSAATDKTTGTSNDAATSAANGVALGTTTGKPATARQQQPQQPPVKRNRRGQPPGLETQTEFVAKLRTQRSTQPPQSARGRQVKPVAKAFTRQHGGRDKDQKAMVIAPTPTQQSQQHPQPSPQPQNQPQTELSTVTPMNPNPNPNPNPTVTVRRRKARTVIYTRSLENLKYQKMSIYNKISLTQERIIGALDRLQTSLLQLPLISNNSHEKQRRERNAFNFCVRFSRNFLYPLRGMIEDVRCTPVANFNSATSNEASQRVVCVYGLMHHSIGRYQRQVRYFLLDKVPQKLSALIEMMYTLTNICLEKGVLDRQDPVVECLQQRCTSFLTFIEDMQEQRFQLARETYRRLQRRVHGHGQLRPGINERYDLKMFLNDLKLYEPRLVPKERTEKRRQRSWIRKTKLLSDTITPQPMPGVNLAQPAEPQQEQPTEDVPTHIECVQCGDYRNDPSSDFEEPSEDQKNQLTNILALLQEPGLEKRKLQQLLEAMEHVTKSKVREVLDPLVRSLGAMLDKKITDETQ